MPTISVSVNPQSDFCTEWPEGLDTDEQCHQHFPLESVTSDYVFAGPSLTDDRARLASIKVGRLFTLIFIFIYVNLISTIS